MTFPRSTDVSRHLARKPKRPAKTPPAPAAVSPAANAELELLNGQLSAAVSGAQPTPKPGSGQ